MRSAHPAIALQLEEFKSWLTSGEPLAIDPEWIVRMMAANAMSAREVEAFFFLFDEKTPLSYTVRDKVAHLPIRGALAKDSRYRTTYNEIARQVAKAADDRKVEAILLDVDSPGGVVSGVDEAESAIRAAAQVKPVHALANDYMASAAYWISSPATKIYSTRYGTTGSIGVMIMHEDFSKMNERIGITPTIITSGRKKSWGHPDQPLSDEARASFQAKCDHYYNMFVGAVAGNRKMQPHQIRGTEGGTYMPEGAKAAGLVDDVKSFEDCAGELSALGGKTMAETTDTTTTETKPAAEVISLDSEREKARAEGRREAAERAKAIQRLCALAGKTELAGDMIATDLTTEQVSEKLIELRAKEDERHRTSGVHGSGMEQKPNRTITQVMIDMLKARGMTPRPDALSAFVPSAE